MYLDDYDLTEIRKYIDSFIENKNVPPFDYSSFVNPLACKDTYKNTASYIMESE